MFGLSSLEWALIGNIIVIALIIILGGGLLLAILGALFAPLLAILSARRAYRGRHVYNDVKALSEGIRKAGRAYRLVGGLWTEVTA